MLLISALEIERTACDGQILIEYSIDDMIDREDFRDKLHVEMNRRIIKIRRNIVPSGKIYRTVDS
jgi:hypothetical protein